MKNLIIARQNGVWMIYHYLKLNNELTPDKTTIDLFGTHILPSAFLGSMDVSQVLDTLRQLNPNANVDCL